MPRSPAPHALTERLEHLEALDAVAKPVQGVVKKLIPNGPVRDALSGTWLGHALHPLVMLVPLGSWTSAVTLDWLGGERSEEAADRLLAISLAALAPTVATGASDWKDLLRGERRVGLVHATSNAVGAGLMAASLRARKRGDRGAGKALALAGMGAAGLGGYLGGHLSYARGVGVDHTAFTNLAREWVEVAQASSLIEGQPHLGEADGTPVVLVRQGGAVHVLADACCHLGGPLHEGEVRDGCIVCPWHGSAFRLEDGGVQRGPAAYPQPVFDVREVEGRVEVRARPPA
ncbi:MAG TPA: Rieske (2Fe-2S) protein [Capillimicrobium sp.]